MPLLDFSSAALTWLGEPDLARRESLYLAYQRDGAPWSDAVFGVSDSAGVPTRCSDELRAFLASDLSDLERLIRRGVPAEVASNGARLFEEASALPAPRIVLMVGNVGSNALQAMTPAGSAAILCVEHLSGAQGCLSMDPELATGWLIHELAHVARYTLPQAASPARDYSGPAAGFFRWLDDLPLIERVLDEGLASALQCEALAHRDPADVLALPADQLDWVETHWERELEAVEDMMTPSGHVSSRRADIQARLLYAVAGEAAEPPPRWGYALGRQLILALRRAGMSWPDLLVLHRRELLQRAATELRSPVLSRLASREQT